MTSMSFQVLTRLRRLYDQKKLRAIDLQFARLLADLGAEAELVLAGAAASFELGRGHVCLPLADPRLWDLSDVELTELLQDLCPPSGWLARFATASSAVLECLAAHSDLPSSARAPLCLWQGRLYLTRYYRYEAALAARLKQLGDEVWSPVLADPLDRLFARDNQAVLAAWQNERTKPLPDLSGFLQKYLDLDSSSSAAALDWAAIRHCLDTAQQPADLAKLDALIPKACCCNDQKLAAATAASRAFTLISGGPGTGKTTTVAKLLALLVEQGITSGQAPVIRLVAPTGKAAARLTESLGAALHKLALSAEIQAAMPTSAGTLHRLLGVIPNSHRFRHHADNPLHLDILVVDEASMVDLPLMARLLDALPAQARLILLGDKDQLASVEAGAVLGDICALLDQPLSQPQADWLSGQTGYRLSSSGEARCLRDGLCLLRKSWRFDAQSGIGQLALACNQGDPAALSSVWDKAFPDIRHQPWLGQSGAYDQLISDASQGYMAYLQALPQASPAQVFQLFNQFQVLCALRDGAFGVTGLNSAIEKALQRQGWLDVSHDWYAGRPVMVGQNDHALGLYNGDIGICMPDADGKLRVWFEQAGGEMRSFLPSRLPAHDTVFAMTIHKSQGSEFSNVILVLPDQYHPLLTRELVYTGITRAKQQLCLYADHELMSWAIRRKTERYSGLADRLAPYG